MRAPRLSEPRGHQRAIHGQHACHHSPGRLFERSEREREREVLTALASGWSSTEIAKRLSIAPPTVKTHISNILTKIGAHARVQAVVFAYETGLARSSSAPRQGILQKEDADPLQHSYSDLGLRNIPPRPPREYR